MDFLLGALQASPVAVLLVVAYNTYQTKGVVDKVTAIDITMREIAVWKKMHEKSDDEHHQACVAGEAELRRDFRTYVKDR